jgi:hypothetical protein
MMDILLIVVIGGMGTLYGAVVGAALFILAQNYLQVLMKQASAMAGAAAAGQPVASRPLAVLARRAVRALGLFLSRRHRRQVARRGAGQVRPTALTEAPAAMRERAAFMEELPSWAMHTTTRAN